MSSDPGFTIPNPHQVAARIPRNMSYVVSPTLKGALGTISIIVVFTAVVSTAVLLPLFSLAPTSIRGILLTLLPAVIVGTLLLISVMLVPMLISGGPLLACDSEGVWVRSRRFPAKAIRMPWHTVTGVYARRWGFNRVVCVQSADPSAGRGQGMFAHLDQAQARLFVGARFVVPVGLADAHETDMLRTLAWYSAGRCPVWM